MNANTIKKELIAPCGMNCGICMAFLREKSKCPGCRVDDRNKPVTRTNCKIKNCDNFRKGTAKYCFECKKAPCDRLEHLDRRYRRNYGMSMIDNLEDIKKSGIRRFIAKERERWACSECPGTVCVHNRKCYDCGAVLKEFT
jgi:hypothetical protein